MATEKQVAFITKLVDERAGVLDEESLLHWQDSGYVRAMSVGEASRVIGTLLAIKVAPKVRAKAQQVEDGIYLDLEGNRIIKVQYNKAQGDGRRTYAKLMVIDQAPEFDGETLTRAAVVHFEYVNGLVREVKPEWRMTLEQAKAFGALYGVCCRCGRDLTDEVSIEAGIGPVCAKRFVAA